MLGKLEQRARMCEVDNSAGCTEDEGMEDNRVYWMYTRSGEDENWRLAVML
ncbi:hypothetical protein J8M20_24350 [Pseudoalteromonas luteoviolacea]|uniref:hypothetical protein n=1 Tax=Pseudoalteromonas luteoviolacea TaxID=43657 RepID=UPI00159F2ED5|nr:hypothetical protein [Pseudoalteromonas luteoviolacea]MBQ4814518.1 hypothetical protein [Pseudoalteromonas luteoviolacea]